MKRLTALLLSLACCGSAGCLFGDPPASPSTVTIVSPVTETFQDAIEVGASARFTFTVGSPDPLRITLASITSPTTGAALTQSLKLQLGTWDGTDCTATFTTTTAAALTPQYLQVAQPGNYCVLVSDPGTMTTKVNFAVRIVHS